MLTKDLVKSVIEHMPESFSVEDLVEELIMHKIKIARKQLENGEFLTGEHLDEEIKSW
jgi:hypothetical protein